MSIIIFTENSDTFNNPSLDAFFKIANQKSIKIFLLPNSNVFNNFHPNVYIISKEYFKIYLKNFIIIKLIKRIFNILIDSFQRKYLLYILKYKKTLCVIGVDCGGLLKCIQFFDEFNLSPSLYNVVYWSFELTFTDEGSDKLLEKKSCKYINHLIIQDIERLNNFLTEIPLTSNVKTHFIPVAPLLNYLNITDSYLISNTHIKSKINSKKYLFFGGSFSDWAGASVIRDMLKIGLPENWVLYINSRFIMSDETLNYLFSYNYNREQVIVDCDYKKTFEELVSFVKGFDCALCLYTPNYLSPYTGKNIKDIGLSSGKMAVYLNAEIPIIYSNDYTLDRLNDVHKFGISVKPNANDIINILKYNELDFRYSYKHIPFLDTEKSIVPFLNYVSNS